MKAFGIELLPPHLAKSDVDFKIEGDNIRYGLSAIKGISEKTLKNVIAFRSNFTNKMECFDAAKEAKINIGALSAMIQAGALDGFGKSRSKLALEAQTYNILTDREKNMIRQMFANGETDILDNIKKLSDATDGDFIIKPSRFETIKKKYEPYKKIYLLNSRNEDLANFWYEYTLLGNPYSQSLNKIYREKNPSFNSIIDIKSKKEGDKVMVVGVVQEVTKRTSQRGNKYVKVIISDETSEVAAMVFDSNRNKIQEMMDKNGGKLPEENDIVVISGAVKGPDAIYINDLGIQSNKIYCKLKDLKDSKETLEN
jgi:DNA polymerase-3 subunit alpha